MGRTGWAVAVAAALLTLAGCGGSHKSSSNTTTSTATTRAVSGGRLTETVGVSGKGKGSGRAAAAPGNTVQIRTGISGGPSGPAQLVTVRAGTGPGTTLKITATAPGHRSRAQITSANGTPLTLVHVYYTCAVPRTPTFCPAQRASSGAHGFTLAFMASPRTGVALTATVGPAAGLPQAAAHPGGLPTAAYTPTELLRARGPAGGTAAATTTSATGTISTTATTPALTATTPALTATTPALTTTTGTEDTSASTGLTPAVTVAPGDTVTMLTRLVGLPGGLPQQTRITIPKGPATALTVSAAVPAAHTARATITRSGGGKLALDPPRFRCGVAPTLTFCPPQSVVSKAHEYVLTFMASPHSPPITLEARVRAG